MAKYSFHKGLKANLPSTGLVEGSYYQCTDTGEIFLATSATDLLLVGHGNKVYLPIEGGNITGTLSVQNNTVFHKGNADNNSTVWHVKSLDIGSTSAVEHIRFHREGFNYVIAPSASINFGSGASAANTLLHINIANNRVGVGTTSPKYTFEVGGSFGATSGKIDGNDIYHKGNLVDIPESALDSTVRAKLNQVLFGHLDNGQFYKEGESAPVTPAVKTLYVDTTSHSEYVWNATDGFVPMGGGGTSDHSQLSNLDYVHSGHTGFQAEISDLSTIRSNASAGKTASDNLGGHTVAKNVPADAKFTDTVYDDTALKGRVSAIEGKESGWDAKYSKPSSGIPKTDLASAVQTSLGKADSAVQPSAISDMATKTWVGQQGFLTEHQSLAEYRKSAAQDTIDNAIKGRLDTIEGKESGWDAKLSDAPSDGKQYARKSGAWSEVEASGVDEAPVDNQSYVRKNGAWTSLGGALNETVVLHITSTLIDLPSTTVYVKNKADGSTLHTLTWVGSDLQFIVKDGINYTVEFAAVSGFTTPASQEYTAFGDTVRNISANYTGILSNGVYIGYTDGTISPYNSKISGKTAEGVVLKTNNIQILLHKSEGSSKQWSSNTSTQISGVTTTTSESTAKTDYKGKSNTAAVVASGLAGSAFTFATALGADWYLPACGEMEQIRLNEANINTALGLIGGTQLAFSSRYYWSSTQYSSSGAWYWTYRSSRWVYYFKGNDYYCRAVRAF